MMKDEFVDPSTMDVKSKRNDDIINMINEGLSYAEIGRRIGLTRARVSQIALEHGYVVRPSLVNLDKYKAQGKG